MDEANLTVAALAGVVAVGSVVLKGREQRRARDMLARAAHIFGMKLYGSGVTGKLDGAPLELKLEGQSRDGKKIPVTLLSVEFDGPSDFSLELRPTSAPRADFDSLFALRAAQEDAARSWLQERSAFVDTLTRLARSAHDVRIEEGWLRVETVGRPNDFSEIVCLIRFMVDVATQTRAPDAPVVENLPRLNGALRRRLGFPAGRLHQLVFLVMFATLLLVVVGG